MSRMSLLAERNSRSAWNARAAVVRCSGARVFLTPSHVKASFTAAIVVRSLWAAVGVVWVTGLLVGWVVDRGDWVWPVVGSVVVAVDMKYGVSVRMDCGTGRQAGTLWRGIQVPPASPWNAPMLNRSAVIARPKKPFLDWLHAVDYDDAPEVTLDQMGPMLYLMADYKAGFVDEPSGFPSFCSVLASLCGVTPGSKIDQV